MSLGKEIYVYFL